MKESVPNRWRATAPNTTEGTILALTEAEVSELAPLAIRLHYDRQFYRLDLSSGYWRGRLAINALSYIFTPNTPLLGVGRA